MDRSDAPASLWPVGMQSSVVLAFDVAPPAAQCLTARSLAQSDGAALRLGHFCSRTTFNDLPPEVVTRAKRHILDTFGAALAGSAAIEPRAVMRMLAAEPSVGSSPAWGTTHVLGSRDTAFANGVAAHALELDDTGGCDHSGAVVLPAALAALSVPVLQARVVSGRDLITAVVLGYDVSRRVLEACGGYSPHNGKGWHSTATCGTFGAAAAVAHLFRLDAERTTSALGHAASFSGGLWAFIHDASQTKRLHAGRAAEGGFTAALLAAQGVTGAAQVFDDVWGGFFNAFASESKQPEALLAEAGSVWKLMRCAIKPHASCRSNHSTIDAVLHLMAAHPGLAQQVAHIDVRLSSFVMDMCGGRDLATLSSTQMSLPYAVAISWIFGDAGLARYLAPARGNARIAAAMSLVRLHVDAHMQALEEPTVSITSTSGAVVSHHVPIPLGAPANPVSDAVLRAKFDALATVVLPRDRADALADHVLHLDEIDDARALLPLLAGHAAQHESIH
ncbi:MmgE/PrpD family protein [Pseudorhodoferax sp.]|uniref:MmgE/PrpD family protein n=1 Tax=Pseudorhodoferax sp. TaxID=1993553 RepID=UPI0039E72191